MKLFLGIDIGASGFKYGIGDTKNGLQCFDTIRLSEKSLQSFRSTFAQIFNRVKKWNVCGIGIGSPGTLSFPDGKIVGLNPNLRFWTNLNPAEIIPEDINLPVFVDNDANLMTLAESGLQDCELCVGITIGSGIGGGIVYQGSVFHGAHGFAAEIGHTIVYPEGELCACGKKGCVEAYSSVDGIRRRLQALNSPYAGMALPNLISLRNRISVVNKVIALGEEAMIRAMANLCTILDPDILIFGGGAMDLSLYNIPTLEQGIKELLPEANAKHLKCVLARYGNRAGVMGGIQMCERMMTKE
ncbi:MAG: ROK family protein [Candidatus Cloacimonetes bacterium]|nr:ROK family protein [Candidatus Cloacimonadota bacterium]MCK9332149.1 ROK family protein [Candidatus Cloacimonadota bacterium]MDD2210378.1 ROK family protein [Candidatus Cloacimonadota bacterium]MDD3282945.1 ROK family protein [Candidatus Cloacimonadota bacterium]